MLKPADRKNSLNWQLILLFMLSVLFNGTVAGQELRSERVVVVQPGETLSQIVERELRSASLWPAVAHHNNIQDGSSITAGQKIRIPLTYTRSNEHAVVLFVKGEVHRRASTPSRDVRLKRGDDIRVGDEIQTAPDGFASVEFSSGSIINVQPNSHISVIDLNCEENDKNCVIELYAGKGGVQSRVNHRPNQPVQFKIGTPSGSAAVRGTVFDIDTSAASSATAVTQGKVDMSAQGVTAGVDTGFGVVSTASSPPGVPSLLLDPPIIKEAPNRLAKGDKVFWWMNDEAESYFVSIAKDQEGTTVESSSNTVDSDYAIPVTLRGNYFINIRSVDTHGLKGMPTNVPVELVATSPQAIVPTLYGELVGDEAIFTLQKGAAADALTYEIQLSDNPDFIEAESYDIGLGQGAVLTLKEGSALWSRARTVFADFNVSEYSEVVRVSR